ncbi:MAG: ABC-F family ATP-binding cassette domain-containing protein [Methyloligellaceae bacterium]
MLHINTLNYRIEGRTLFEGARASIPMGHRVGLVGRNGTGKTTLLKLIDGTLHADDGDISYPRGLRAGRLTQEAPNGPESLLDTVLSADRERANLLRQAQNPQSAEQIAEVQLRLTDIDAHSAPARAATILAGLGFDEEAQARPCNEYSGGWRMRVALASLLFTEPDFLLLDEPSNFLDLEGTQWLRAFILNYRHTVILVSHDRELLNGCVDHILFLNNGRLTLFSGGYDAFEKSRLETQRRNLKLKKQQDDERRRLEAFVERFRAKATKASQAQARVKQLEKMTPIAAEIDREVIPFLFTSPDQPLGNPLVRIEQGAVGYAPDQLVLSQLDLRIDATDRIGVLGPNGNGKSTLANLITDRLTLQKGTKRQSKKMRIGYFTQNLIDNLNSTLTPYQYFTELFDEATEAQKRAKLGQFGFGIEKADTPVANLSGGEKARLLFAIISLDKPHLLVLDEPTNHLDVDSREALIRALNEFEGALMLISHDRHLIESTVDNLWVVGGGTTEPYDGTLDQYIRDLETARKNRMSQSRADRDSGKSAANTRSQKRREAAAQRAELAPLKKKMLRCEEQVNRLSEALDSLDQKLANPRLYEQEGDRLQTLTKERGEVARDLQTAEEEWIVASEALEAAQNQQS